MAARLWEEVRGAGKAVTRMLVGDAAGATHVGPVPSLR
jgi:hypothetical protein